MVNLLNGYVLDERIDPDIKIIAAGDTSSVNSMDSMFYYCTSLTSVSLFDTSSVTDMYAMFWGCSSLTSVPLFDVSNVTGMGSMFKDCTKVESGAFDLYIAVSKTGKVTSHTNAFENCGRDTTTGLAELNEIPTSWGGLKAS